MELSDLYTQCDVKVKHPVCNAFTSAIKSYVFDGEDFLCEAFLIWVLPHLLKYVLNVLMTFLKHIGNDIRNNCGY